MPDGSEISFDNQLFRCSEISFRPVLYNLESNGGHSLAYDCIQSAGIENRKSLYENIVLCGGNTLFPGFAERLTNDVKLLAPEDLSSNVKVYYPSDRKFSSILGGSVLAVSE